MVLFSLAVMAFARSSTDLLCIHIKTCDEFDVAKVVTAEVDVHQSRNDCLRICVSVVVNPWIRDEAQLPTHAIATRMGVEEDAYLLDGEVA
jgi:hypothetical protein